MSSLAGPSTFRRFVLPGLAVLAGTPRAFSRRCLATGTRICFRAAGAPEAPRPPRGRLCRVTRVAVPGEMRSPPGEGVGTVVRARGVLLMFSSNNPTQIQNGLFELNPNPYNTTVHKSTIQ